MVQACVKIVVCAPKGGVGKTTLIMGLLVLARKAGIRAIGVNMDEQQTLTSWNDHRERTRKALPDQDIVDVPVIARKLDDYRSVIRRDLTGFDLAIFDTPPGHSQFRSAIASLCDVAELIVIPTGASAVDLAEVIPFGEQHAGQKGIYCLNKVNRRANSFIRAQKRLNGSGRLCPVAIPLLESIHAHFDQGLTINDLEGKEGRGSDDFEAVWNTIRREIRL